MIEVMDEQDFDSLFIFGYMIVFSQGISGFDEFEFIVFFVIVEVLDV